ncbi:LSU ribosomal protein L32P [Thalassoporum mexicanum PCC 7367]|uniref:50S ribosomal protein L32 n=1 Tax=Thalassoporum mexicanum TaxID=3457544 RepID=UPI00029FA029|nr:50S ribosomal protein L32 [Pseudanabaena sp. PCC 7367]AFY70557.1 LSU ribosomal protein L32P [Pseudanabaena sp. PCC 7367]
MAAPKKKTSKQKTRSRKATWKRKAALQAERALSLGKSILTNRNTGFMYPLADEADEDEE